MKAVTVHAVMYGFHQPGKIDNMWHLEVLSLRINWIIISILQMENLNNNEFEDLFKLKSQFKECGIDFIQIPILQLIFMMK